MDFRDALGKLREGKRVAREGWNGKGMWVALGADSLASAPYLYIRTAGGERVPWTASQTDLLADDWRPVAGEWAGHRLGEPSDVDKAAARVVLAFASRGRDLYRDLIEPMQDLDEALDRAGRS